MSRLSIPSVEASAPAAQTLLAAVHKQLGVVPNLMKLVGHSPAALEGYLALSGALGKGRLGAPVRERIALAVAEANGCDYCLSAHSYLGLNLAKLPAAEVDAARDGQSSDPRPCVRAPRCWRRLWHLYPDRYCSWAPGCFPSAWASVWASRS
jgi:AhpD family alkylhydroperoxidase